MMILFWMIPVPLEVSKMVKSIAVFPRNKFHQQPVKKIVLDILSVPGMPPDGIQRIGDLEFFVDEVFGKKG